MPARSLGRLVGSLLLLAVLAIGSYAASAGGFTSFGQQSVADSVDSTTIASPAATDAAVATDWGWA